MEDTRKVAQYSYLRLGSVQLVAKVIVSFRNLESMCLQGSDWTLDLPMEGTRPVRYTWRRRATGLPGTLAPWRSFPVFMVIYHPANQEYNFRFMNLFLFLQFSILPYVPPYKSS